MSEKTTKPQSEISNEFHLVAHAHIDLSWLWPRGETLHEVCPLTFRSVFRMMDDFPDFIFAQSSAQIYKWMERFYPDIFEAIKKRVREGRWEIVGGSWCEHNANILSGESLVRQHLYAKRYFKEKFDVDVSVGWLPDTFGFNWNMPQIYQKCGINSFMTHKMKWQDFRNTPFTPFPHYLFWWQGSDGSRVLAFHTVSCYDEKILADVLTEDMQKFKNKHGIDKLLIVFGEGDHGGGPLPDMLQRAKDYQVTGEPGEIIYTSARGYFDTIAELDTTDSLPVVNDELYIQSHRGTHTTDGQVKRDNRTCEILFGTIEALGVIAHQIGIDYPASNLKTMWETLMFNQVHDNIDGTSIREVYLEMATDYQNLKVNGRKLLYSLFREMTQKADTTGAGTALHVFNPLAWTRSEVVKILESDWPTAMPCRIKDEAGKDVCYQVIEDNGNHYLMFVADELPGLAIRQYRWEACDTAPEFETDLSVTETTLRNGKVAITIDPNTGNVEVLDRSDQQVRQAAYSTGLEVWEDNPPDPGKDEPAWNIHLGECHPLETVESIQVVETGPLRAVVRIQKKYKNSMFEQDIILYCCADQADVLLKVDWHEHERFAKAAFHLPYETHFASYEIPFGFIERFSHLRETDLPLAEPQRRWEPMDQHKWEVAALRWVNVNDPAGKRGLAVLNDCKYGYSFDSKTMRMSLVRGARRGTEKQPDYWSDQSDHPIVGIHRIRYALLPYKGDWDKMQVSKRAAGFNTPMITQFEQSHTGMKLADLLQISADSENVVVEAVKQSEDSKDVIIRIYEATGRATKAQIKCTPAPTSVTETDMIEWDQYVKPQKYQITADQIIVPLKAHEIKTLRLSHRT